MGAGPPVGQDVPVRFLFSFAGDSGHFFPLVPVARSAQAAGHTVAFACRPRMVSTVERAGFAAFSTGVDEGAEQKRIPLRELDPQREDRALRDGFAGWMAQQRAAGMLSRCTDWQPDLCVCDETDFGAMVAAQRLELPYASVLVSVSGSFVRPQLLAEPLTQLRLANGLPADPDLDMLSRYLVLCPAPASLRDPAWPLPATAHHFRPDEPQATTATPPLPWLADLADRPTVYVTLGTVFNLESGDLFSRILAGLRTLPVNVVATVGRQLDPAELGPQPGNVHIERFIPQSAILPRCQAVVSHGGSGSVVGALSHGLPMVLIPMGADQPNNAARCASLGVATVLDAVSATPAQITAAVSAVLSHREYRQAALRLREQFAALPDPAHTVDLLERLVRHRAPLPGDG